MRVRASMKISELRKVGDRLGRAGMSELALSLVDGCDGSYKGVMELCGKLSVIAKMATFDDYLLEQVNRGVGRANYICGNKEIIASYHQSL